MSAPLRTDRSGSGAARSIPKPLLAISSQLTKSAIFKRAGGMGGAADWERLKPCLLYLLAFGAAVYGSNIIAGSPDSGASSDASLAAGAPWLIAALALWLAGGLSGNAQALRGGWRGLSPADRLLRLAGLLPFVCWLVALLLAITSMRAESAWPSLRAAGLLAAAGAIAWRLIERAAGRARAQADAIVSAPIPLIPRRSRRAAMALLLKRAPLFALASAASAQVWQNSAGNTLPPPYFELWLISAVLWSMAFAPLEWNVFNWATVKVDRVRRFSWRRHGWVALAFLGIMLLGALFRLVELDALPRDMINYDHELEIRAAYDFSQGENRIAVLTFQAQQPLHAYLLSWFAKLPFLSFDFLSLKIATVLVGLVTLPVVFWMGVELMGPRQRQRGHVLGLVAMGLVAVSYWHVSVVRFGLRAHLAALFAALSFVFLARAMRRNRRCDFIKLGLTLGYGLYAYTATMVLPLACLFGVALALACRRFSAREAARYLVNLAVSGIIAFTIYLPMHHVAQEFSDIYTRVTLENLFDYVDGSPIDFDPDVFLTGLMANFHDALLMFHWRGDGQALWSAPRRPALDIYSAGSLALGLAAWLAQLARRPRDPVWLLLPVLALVMLLPTTLAVMRPENNPSNMRAAGAIPAIYCLAALPIVHIAFVIAQTFPKRLGKALALLFCSSLLLLANQRNSALYFDVYAGSFDSAPYGHVGKTIRSLAASGTPLSNVIVISYPRYWHGHNVFVAAGAPELLNETPITRLHTHIENARQRKDEYRLDPARDLVFLHAQQDTATAQALRRWFPGGRSTLIRSYLPAAHAQGSYELFRVPAMGEAGLDALRDLPRG